MSATEIAELVNTRRASAVEIMQGALTRLEAAEPALRAFRRYWPEQALRDAEMVDQQVAAGTYLPFAGVPLGIKASEAGDSPQRQRLRAAGCVPIGATATPGPGTAWQTWGDSGRGPTENPWLVGRSPGGSSAGSAAAVAAEIVPLATGIDGAGSIRIPAAWCGVIGLKITNGLVGTRDRSGLAAPGPMCRSAEDASRYLDILLPSHGATNRPPSHDPAGPAPRACWSPDLGFARVDAEQEAVAQLAFTRMTTTGIVRERAEAVRLRDPRPAWLALRSPTEDHTAAQQLREDNDRRLEAFFERVDVLITPTTPGTAHGHSGPGDQINTALTWSFNLSGHPAVSLPAGFDTQGCPVGLQLVTRRGQEHLLLTLAARYQEITTLAVPP